MDRRFRDRGMCFVRVHTYTTPPVWHRVHSDFRKQSPGYLSRIISFRSSLLSVFIFAITHTELGTNRIFVRAHMWALEFFKTGKVSPRTIFMGIFMEIRQRRDRRYVIAEKEDLVGNDIGRVASVETRRMLARIIIIHFFPKHSEPRSALPLCVYYSSRNISFARLFGRRVENGLAKVYLVSFLLSSSFFFFFPTRFSLTRVSTKVYIPMLSFAPKAVSRKVISPTGCLLFD